MNGCKAILKVGDDYEDNVSTFRCQKWESHSGAHCETWIDDAGNRIVVKWRKDPGQTKREEKSFGPKRRSRRSERSSNRE